MPINFAVNIVWRKVYIKNFQFDDLAFHTRSQWRLKLDKFLTCTINAIYQTVFKAIIFTLGIALDYCRVCMLMLMSRTLTLMKGHNGLAEEQIQHWIILTILLFKSVISCCLFLMSTACLQVKLSLFSALPNLYFVDLGHVQLHALL